MEEQVECVWSVAGIRFGGPNLKKNFILSSPQADLGDNRLLEFFIFLQGVYFMKWNVEKKVCLFLSRADGTMTDSRDEIYSTRLCLNRDCTGLNLS